jgi:hypothetical protein
MIVVAVVRITDKVINLRTAEVLLAKDWMLTGKEVVHNRGKLVISIVQQTIRGKKEGIRRKKNRER